MRPGNVLSWTRQRVALFLKSVWLRYKSLPILAKALVWGVVLFDLACLTVLAIIGPSSVTQTFYDLAQDLANYKYGWIILGGIMIILCFPPLIFYTTSVTLCGFAYGLKGFLVAGPASLIGSTIAFIVLRFAFRMRLRAWTSKNEKWQALETVIRAKGLPLIILIRISPFPPWVYSNACFASIEAVSLWQFIVATLCVMPKLFLVVFIGSRIAKFSDGKQRGEMDTITRVLDIMSIVVSIALGVLAGTVTYRLLQKQVKQLHENANRTDELAAEALEEAEEGAPLLRNISSDTVDVEGS
ncbi:hypothetical protein M0805_007485 [Coniferiporia weirii]|nr:hypothetical protein M0805_007485 [Coniferiporia weirii]